MSRATLKNFVVEAKDGAFGFKSPQHRAIFKDFVKQFEGKTLWLTVDSKEPKRTDSQNSFYWLYISIIEQDCGNTKEELHEYFKKKFLSVKKEVLGEVCDVPISTTNLSTYDFSEYMQKIEALTEVPIPDPTPFQIALTHDEYKELKNAQNIRESEQTTIS